MCVNVILGHNSIDLLEENKGKFHEILTGNRVSWTIFLSHIFSTFNSNEKVATAEGKNYFGCKPLGNVCVCECVKLMCHFYYYSVPNWSLRDISLMATIQPKISTADVFNVDWFAERQRKRWSLCAHFPIYYNFVLVFVLNIRMCERNWLVDMAWLCGVINTETIPKHI